MHLNGPELVAIDPDSDGGLGGTSDDLFGPLVRCFVKLSHVVRPCSGFIRICMCAGSAAGGLCAAGGGRVQGAHD